MPFSDGGSESIAYATFPSVFYHRQTTPMTCISVSPAFQPSFSFFTVVPKLMTASGGYGSGFIFPVHRKVNSLSVNQQFHGIIQYIHIHIKNPGIHLAQCFKIWVNYSKFSKSGLSLGKHIQTHNPFTTGA